VYFSPMTSVADAVIRKAELRAAVLERRDALAPEVRRAAAEAIAARGLPVAPKAGAIVSGYMPIRSEINPLALLRRYAEAGAQIALPAIVARGEPLSMRVWAVGEKLVPGQWGIREPEAAARQVAPDIMLVPLAAFDRRGSRIGYGAGYYDRTIAELRLRKTVVAIGIAYAVQEVEAVPALPHDARLDLVLTEREQIDCGGA
jgi:5-formyltetrahydrofolate cyclo-ligase